MTRSPFSPLEVNSLVDAIAQRITEAIVTGRLAPGERVSELGLSRMLGVSRGPLREAIRQLEGRKLVQRTPNIGVRVAYLSPRDVDQLMVVREALEAVACRSAALHMPDGEIRQLRALLEDHGRQEQVRRGTGYYQGPPDLDFHLRIIRGCGNERLIEMLCGSLYDLLRVHRYRASTLEGRTRAAFEEHRAIVAALEARDAEGAEASMRIHIRNARAHASGQATLPGPDGVKAAC